VGTAARAYGLRFDLPANRTLKLWKVIGWSDAPASTVFARIHNETDAVVEDERDLSGGIFDEGAPLASWSYSEAKRLSFYAYNSSTSDTYTACVLWLITIE